jgi:hypothetical protein
VPPFLIIPTWTLLLTARVSIPMEHHARLRMQGLPSIKVQGIIALPYWHVSDGPARTSVALDHTMPGLSLDNKELVVPSFRWRHPSALSALRQDRLRDITTPSSDDPLLIAGLSTVGGFSPAPSLFVKEERGGHATDPVYLLVAQVGR